MSMTTEEITYLLEEAKLDALLITNISNIIYLTHFNHFSLTEREGYILLTKKNQYILTDARYSESVIEHVPHFNFREISGEKRLSEHILEITREEKLTNIGFETSDMRVAEYTYQKKNLKGIKLTSTHNLIEKTRELKKDVEIEKLKKACALADKAFQDILPHIKPGVCENELAFWIETYFRQHNADISFNPIVAFGAHAAIPHHGSGGLPLSDHSVVLIDFGAKVENYCSDMTRTIFVQKPTTEEARLYQTVLLSQQKAIKAFEKNTKQKYEFKAKRIDELARNVITSANYPSIPHALGHGIGIEVHESPTISPRSKDVLKPGMVFSIEPGIYIPGKIGVRIEDLVYLKKDGFEVITKAPSELIVL